MDKQNYYLYTDNNLLENPNNYFYTNYNGLDFISAWYENRMSVNKYPGIEVSPPGSGYCTNLTSYATKDILEYLYASIDAGKSTQGILELFIQRFEVSKRIYNHYTDKFRATEGADYQQLSHYIRFAEVLDLSYKLSGLLSQLNSLIKVLDILVSVADQITADLSLRFYRLLNSEKEHVQSLITKLEIKVNA